MKSKAYFAINISGLVIGTAAALILAKYVGFSLSYDQFHENKENIFAVYQEEHHNGIIAISGNDTYRALGPFAKEAFPEVARVSQYATGGETLVTSLNNDGDLVKFNERKVYKVDPDFLKIFSFDFIEGGPVHALDAPNSVVITESTAKRYFKEKEALGRTFKTSLPWGEKSTLKVSAVIKDVPHNSQIRFDFLQTTIGTKLDNSWEDPSYQIYMLLNDEVNPQLLAKKMSDEISSKVEFLESKRTLSFELIPVADKQLSNTEFMLALVGGLTLLVTWINFINLTSAKSLNRYKEMGMRKVMGSGKSQIIWQYVFEGFLLNSVGLICAVFLTWLLYPSILFFTNGRILPLFNFQTNNIFISLFLLGSVLSSIYPAIVLSSSKPIDALKGKLQQGAKSGGFRKSLVVIQFSISLVLIIGVFIISDQMHFMQNRELGVDLSRTLIINTAKDGGDWGGKIKRLKTFKTQVRALSMVEGVTSSTMVPGSGVGHIVNYQLNETDEIVPLNLIGMDANYMDYYGLKILAGEPFMRDKRYWQNKKTAIINKSAAYALGYSDIDEAVGKIISPLENKDLIKIVGVMDDYHHQSVKEDIAPMAFDFNPFRGHISIKLSATNYASHENLGRAIQHIESIWDEVYPDQAFDHYFLDEHFNTQYQDDIKFRKVFGVFTGISVIIACLGLFGLSLFVFLKRKKEVGIRKTFGASSINIYVLFCKDYLTQILIAVVLGLPLAILIMDKWLENYSYRTSIGVWSIMIPITFLITISLLSISFQTFKAAIANPIDALRDE